MSKEAFNKINQTKHLFQKITAPLMQSLGLSFGYMIIFNDSSYYTIIDDMKCLNQFVTHVDQSHIFCDRNVTNYFDKEYNFTLWPKIPVCNAMKIYHKHNIRDGITVSKISDKFTELYWFTAETIETDRRKFFIRNKSLLLEFIRYFEAYKKNLFIPGDNIQQELFKFSKGFDLNLPKSEYLQEESCLIKSFFSHLGSNNISIKNFQEKAKLSGREIEILSMTCRGFTAKHIAQNIGISFRTVQNHLEHIKNKTNVLSKIELITLYESGFDSES